MAEIISPYLGLNALREAGYRSTATAVAELVDNSIEAGAKNIEIIALSRDVFVGQKTTNQVQQIAVLDDGLGMEPNILANCLSMGWGTRLGGRSGLGRFGFGLKGSSISQARRVEVFSWTPKSDVMTTYLDLDEIKGGKVNELPEPRPSELPGWVSASFQQSIGDSGTLVVWSNLDKIDLKEQDLTSRVNAELCRIYRHFLDDDDTYGEKRHVRVHDLQIDAGQIRSTQTLLANDPLYLLSPNNVPGYSAEATNEEFERFKVPIKFELDGYENESDVEFIFSIAKPEIQKLGGNSALGKHYAKNTGISFVRKGREIDFGDFGFLEASEPRHRWWGAEVRFEPVLDELFGLTNNKQSVRSVKKLDDDALAALSEEGDYKSKLQVELSTQISQYVKKMMSPITARGAGSGSSKKVDNKIVDKVNKIIKVDSTLTDSAQHAAALSAEEKLQERIELLVKSDASLTPEEAKDVATETLDYGVDVQTGEWPGSVFLDRKPIANASVGIVNRNSAFYEKFWLYLQEKGDSRGFEGLKVLILALVRAEDESIRRGDEKAVAIFRELWGYWVEQLIDQAGD